MITAEEVHNSHWRYGIVKHHYTWKQQSTNYVSLNELYYENDELAGYTDALDLDGFSDEEDLIEVLEMMLQDAKNYPAIDEDDLPGDVDDKDN